MDHILDNLYLRALGRNYIFYRIYLVLLRGIWAISSINKFFVKKK
jgi:hypothetical protein